MNMMTVSLNDSESVELMRIGDSNSPLVVSINSFQGQRYFDVRRYYLDKGTKTIKPGPKGISLKEDEFELISNFILENLNQIKNLFITELSAGERTVRGNRRENLARKKIKNTTRPVEYTFESWPGPNFFAIDDSSEEIAITFNKRNTFIEKLSKSDAQSKDLIAEIIGAYIYAKNNLEFGRKVTAETVTDFLEITWGHGFK